MIQQSIKKEFILVSRDLHSLAVLFILPVVFMLLMTYAMSEKKANVLKSIDIHVNQHESSKNQTLFLNYLSRLGYQLNSPRSKADASLHFNADFQENLFSANSDTMLVVDFNSRTSLQIQSLIQQHLQLAFARLKLHLYLIETGDIDDTTSIEQQMDMVIKQSDTSHLIESSTTQQKLPVTAYSVPAWLIFGVFFIVLPISVTLINEQQSGTLMRLKTFPINLPVYFLLKLSAFFCISLLQLLILALVGLRVIPIFVDLSPIPFEQLWHILLVGIFISLSAVSFAAIIAAAINTFEQAVVLGGGINIIVAALSGFMVPLDVMPQNLQNIAEYSPMYWSAELIKVSMFELPTENNLTNIIYLCLFSIFSLVISILLFSRKIRKLQWN